MKYRQLALQRTKRALQRAKRATTRRLAICQAGWRGLLVVLAVVVICLGAVGCAGASQDEAGASQDEAGASQNEAGVPSQPAVLEAIPSATATLLPNRTPEPPTLTSVPSPLPASSETPRAMEPTPALTATVCPVDAAAQPCSYPGVLLLSLPVAPPANTQVDGTYRFGSTQKKKRDPHHGVEFLNAASTPVLAAGDGVVVVAGTDAGANMPPSYSPWVNFYGNLVVIEHRFPAAEQGAIPGFEGPLYTLYAHLSEVLVEEGQEVRQGQEIGKIGMTGGATGNHLHFEARLGENTYAAAHNPELWLRGSEAAPADSAAPTDVAGALAGRVFDPAGKPVAVKSIVVEHLVDGAGSASDWEIYLDSYEEKALLGRPPWGESFAAGNLPPGWYRISFPRGGLQSQEVQILPGELVVVTFLVDG
jgi:murein DD-endopeptidase MepM/ murein hydrolase activator NlpD